MFQADGIKKRIQCSKIRVQVKRASFAIFFAKISLFSLFKERWAIFIGQREREREGDIEKEFERYRERERV